jgi:hypothetical protein
MEKAVFSCRTFYVGFGILDVEKRWGCEMRDCATSRLPGSSQLTVVYTMTGPVSVNRQEAVKGRYRRVFIAIPLDRELVWIRGRVRPDAARKISDAPSVMGRQRETSGPALALPASGPEPSHLNRLPQASSPRKRRTARRSTAAVGVCLVCWRLLALVRRRQHAHP